MKTGKGTMDKEGPRHRFRDQLKFDPLSRFDSSERRLAKHSSLNPAVSESVADDATNLLSGKIHSSYGKISDQEGQNTDDQTGSNDDSDNGTIVNKFLEIVKWSCNCFDKVPKREKLEKKIWLKERVSWTVFVLFIFTVCSQSHESVDPFHYMRVTWASTRGTFMEFGIMPIVASRTTLKKLDCFKIFNENDNSFSRNGAENLLALVLTVVLSLLFTMTGMYGEIESTGVVIISMQLFLAGFIIIMLNDLVKKGYCLDTEISLFIVAKICGTIMWKAFSPATVYTDQGAEYEGAFVFLLTLFSTKNDKTVILSRAFSRQNFPNLGNFLVTFLVFFFVICSKKLFERKHKLFTSVAPLYLQSYCVPIFNLFAQVLSEKFNEHFFVNLLGVWADIRSDGPPRSYPIGGLCYYLTPPRTPLQMKQDSAYTVVYIVFMIASCVSCSIIDTRRKNNNKSKLKEEINMAAVNGFFIGTLSCVADFLGVFGSGTRVITAAISIYNYTELIKKYQNENKEKNSFSV